MRYRPLFIAGLVLVLAVSPLPANSTYAKASWDSLKALASPQLMPAFQNEFSAPYRQPLADYGWEDGLHISRDGLHLYALYSPMDIFSWNMNFANNPNAALCDLLGNMRYIRPYANTYGMDLKTNAFGCDSFGNIDILYAHRASAADYFTSWQLSGIARPGMIEGGPTPLFSRTGNTVDFFLFTGDGDMWMIKNTTANPSGIDNAIRLPSPLNPVSNEFNADNPFIERLNRSDTLILIYEKYSDGGANRDFMISLSLDNGLTWNPPYAITTVNPGMGHIEHPHLYCDANKQWWLYYSLNYDICRSRQTEAGNWDSWAGPELIMAKGNALALGEPSITADGGISFLVAYANSQTNDSADLYDCDPWYLPKKPSNAIEAPLVIAPMQNLRLFAAPNPFTANVAIRLQGSFPKAQLRVYDINGKCVADLTDKVKGGRAAWNASHLPNGIYVATLAAGKQSISVKITLLK